MRAKQEQRVGTDQEKVMAILDPSGLPSSTSSPGPVVGGASPSFSCVLLSSPVVGPAPASRSSASFRSIFCLICKTCKVRREGGWCWSVKASMSAGEAFQVQPFSHFSDGLVHNPRLACLRVCFLHKSQRRGHGERGQQVQQVRTSRLDGVKYRRREEEGEMGEQVQERKASTH